MLELSTQYITGINDLTDEDIALIMKISEDMKSSEGMFRQNLAGVTIACLFYEPSTRTRLSFEAAAHRLGARVISETGVAYSSVAKGETLEDTIQTVGQYADIIVLRHPNDDAAMRAAAVSPVPLINAGAGKGEHPTQALLDAFTIHERFHDDMTINAMLVGDLKYGRTVHSLARLLPRIYRGRVTYTCVAPVSLQFPEGLVREVRRKSNRAAEFQFFGCLEESYDHVERADVLYVTRTQVERLSETERSAYKGVHVVTPDVLARLPKDAIIMHPFPRKKELPPDVDRDPRAVYFEQIKNGLFVRMALLKLLARR